MIGIGFYLGVALCRLDSFKGTTVTGFIRGFILGMFLWPIGALLVVLVDRKDKSETTATAGES